MAGVLEVVLDEGAKKLWNWSPNGHTILLSYAA